MFETGSLEWVLLLVFLPVVGIIIGFVVASTIGIGSRVLYVRERDKRGKQYNIKEEDPHKIFVKGKPELRFYKLKGSIEFIGNFGKKITTFFAKEGTAYSMALEGGRQKINTTFGDIAQVIWGKDFYKTIPEDRRREIETRKINITVDLESGLTPPGYEPINEQTINKDANEQMAGYVAKGVTKGMAIPWINYIFSIGCGTGITFAICLLMGWIKLA